MAWLLVYYAATLTYHLPWHHTHLAASSTIRSFRMVNSSRFLHNYSTIQINNTNNNRYSHYLKKNTFVKTNRRAAFWWFFVLYILYNVKCIYRMWLFVYSFFYISIIIINVILLNNLYSIFFFYFKKVNKHFL